jgi:spore coat protein U-like protein
MNRFRSILFAGLALAVPSLLVGGAANAASTNGTLTVTSSIAASCSINSPTLAFGAYDPLVTNLATPLDQSTTLTVTCTNGSPITLELDAGLTPATGSTAPIPLRQMVSGANKLAYFLYTASDHATAWGATTAAVSDTGNGTAQNHSIFGRVTAGQNLPVGTYSDTVTATVNF